MERVLYNGGSSSHAQRLFEVADQPVVLRWSGLDGEFELRVYLGVSASRCGYTDLDHSYPYTGLGGAGPCEEEPDPVVITGSGAMVLSDPGKYVIIPLNGAEPTVGLVVADTVTPAQAHLLLAARQVELVACANSAAANACPVEPPLGVVTSWN